LLSLSEREQVKRIPVAGRRRGEARSRLRSFGETSRLEKRADVLHLGAIARGWLGG
jgi:hypothetical protein